jgi:DNA mismatch endonuclease (patch repair protein)
MVDVHSSAQRSANMSAIRSKNTKPELVVRRALHSRGYRYRTNVRGLPGTPDIVFTRKRLTIFVNGCFWHSHDCKYGSVKPASNVEFWTQKRDRTSERDRRNAKILNEAGWRVVVIWECELRDEDRAITDLVEVIGTPSGPGGDRS